jgi:porin
MNRRLNAIILSGIAGCAAILAAQGPVASSAPAEANAPQPAQPQDAMDSLNLQGADMAIPPFSDAVIDTDSPFRRDLARRGFAFRFNVNESYFQNALAAPVPKAQQVYVGDRATWRSMINPILTSDLRFLGLHDAQFFGSAAVNRTDWNPDGPNSLLMTCLYLYKAFAGKRVETKIGYINNDWEFVGMFVGGSLSAGSQGVYAVLPFEVGLSRFPLPAPSFNVSVQGTRGVYGKVAFQRSLEPAGGQANITRNATGFRFAPAGDKLLMAYEGGYLVNSSANSLSTWIRGGYIRNLTPYANFRTGGTTVGNSSAYLLADQQIVRAGSGGPGNGFFAGATAMRDPSALNIYSQYYEARLYQKGITHARPLDMASVVATYTAYSPDFTKGLAAQGQSYWRGSTTISASYTIALHHGVYAGAGATYNSAPAVTPHVSRALVAALQLNCFF